MQSMEAVNAPFLGVVLNDVNLRTNDYRYYNGYISTTDRFVETGYSEEW